MNSRLSTLRSKKVLIPAAAVVVLAAAGGGLAMALDGDDHGHTTLTGTEATKVGEAAKKAAELPDAVVAKVEQEDEDGVTTYEVTLDNPTGGRYEVELNSALGLITVDNEGDGHGGKGRDHEGDRVGSDTQGADGSDRSHGSGASSDSDGSDSSDAATTRTVGGVTVDESEGPISDAQVAKAVAAAQKAIAEGTVVEVSSNKPSAEDTGLDAREAYSVEVTTGSGTTLVKHEVDLDASFTVLRTNLD